MTGHTSPDTELRDQLASGRHQPRSITSDLICRASRSKDPVVLLRIAYIFYARNQIDNAGQAAHAASLLTPSGDWRALSALSYCQWLVHLNVAARDLPKPTTWRKRGVESGAISIAHAAFELHRSAGLANDIGHFFHLANDTTTAQEWFARALELDPAQRHARLNLPIARLSSLEVQEEDVPSDANLTALVQWRSFIPLERQERVLSDHYPPDIYAWSRHTVLSYAWRNAVFDDLT
jgi:hypothetical protein